jgi:hypothetical protein
MIGHCSIGENGRVSVMPRASWLCQVSLFYSFLMLQWGGRRRSVRRTQYVGQFRVPCEKCENSTIRSQGSTTPIRKALISLILQPGDHFIHPLTTLREEVISAVSCRLINLKITFLAHIQRRCIARKDEIRGQSSEATPEEDGLMTRGSPGDCYALRIRITCALCREIM